jgi:hypothetical protein
MIRCAYRCRSRVWPAGATSLAILTALMLAESSLTGIYSRMGSFDYFVTIPSGPDAKAAFTRGFFDAVLSQTPKPQTVAIMGADREFSTNAAAFDSRKRKRHARETDGIGPLSTSLQPS